MMSLALAGARYFHTATATARDLPLQQQTAGGGAAGLAGNLTVQFCSGSLSRQAVYVPHAFLVGRWNFVLANLVPGVHVLEHFPAEVHRCYDCVVTDYSRLPHLVGKSLAQKISQGAGRQ